MLSTYSVLLELKSNILPGTSLEVTRRLCWETVPALVMAIETDTEPSQPYLLQGFRRCVRVGELADVES